MDYRKITAIINASRIQAVEEALKHEETIEVAITRIKGYGDDKNFFSPEWTSTRARVEVFATATHAAQIAHAIMGAAHEGLESDGIVAVLPLKTLYKIKDHHSD